VTGAFFVAFAAALALNRADTHRANPRPTAHEVARELTAIGWQCSDADAVAIAGICKTPLALSAT
jgi:hypothetical protein